MSYKLEKPLSIEERADFIVEHNHNNDLNIEETDFAIYALEPWEKLEGDEVIEDKEAWEERQAQAERERIAKLYLTGADVERGIYQAKGMDFDDIIALVEHLSETTIDEVTGEVIQQGIDIDVKALKIELKANNFYRGNPYVNAVGALLGFTSKQLDKFFETKDYTVLLPPVIEPEEPVDDGVTEYDTPEEVEDENTTDASI